METISAYLAGQPEGELLFARVTRLLRRTAAPRHPIRLAAGGLDPEDLVADFITGQLLDEGQAGLNYLAALARDDGEAARLLVRMFQRYLGQARRSIRLNKLKALRELLEHEGYCRLPGEETAYTLPGREARPLSAEQFQQRLPAWIEAFGAAHITRGHESSTQLPIILHADELRRMADFALEHADGALTLRQLFAFVDQAAGLAHWEHLFLLREQAAPAGTPLDGDEPAAWLERQPDHRPTPADQAEQAELDALVPGCLAELDALQRGYLRLLFSRRNDGRGPPVKEWLRERGLSPSTFYNRELPRLHGTLRRWRAAHPDLPARVLARLIELSPGESE